MFRPRDHLCLGVGNSLGQANGFLKEVAAMDVVHVLFWLGGGVLAETWL